jgi:outer membrane protein TolC
LVSCAVGPDYQPPESPLPAKFAAMSSLTGLGDQNADRALETTKWWRTLHDRELDSLVERAIGANPTLEIALDRLQQARAQEAVVIARRCPRRNSQLAAGGALGPISPAAASRRCYGPPKTPLASGR